MKKVVIATDKNLDTLKKLPKTTIIQAYKIVRKNGAPPVYSDERPKLRYRVGKTVIENNFDTNRYEDCGAGLNVATMQWCTDICYPNACYKHEGDRIITVRFSPASIVCVPHDSKGKFRVKRLKVVKSAKVTWR
jgi:hypothetical protein